MHEASRSRASEFRRQASDRHDGACRHPAWHRSGAGAGHARRRAALKKSSSPPVRAPKTFTMFRRRSPPSPPADIENMGIQKPQDFLSAVPNVTFIQTQNAGTSFLVMRGISQARNSAPSAAIVVDGVPMTQPAQFNQQPARYPADRSPQGAAGRAVWSQRHRWRHHHQDQAAHRYLGRPFDGRL